MKLVLLLLAAVLAFGQTTAPRRRATPTRVKRSVKPKGKPQNHRAMKAQKVRPYKSPKRVRTTRRPAAA